MYLAVQTGLLAMLAVTQLPYGVVYPYGMTAWDLRRMGDVYTDAVDTCQRKQCCCKPTLWPALDCVQAPMRCHVFC